MKKLLVSLLSISILGPSVAGVISCNSSPDLYSTTSFAEKINSLNELDGNILEKAGMSLSSIYTDDVLNGFIDGITASGDIDETSPSFAQLKANVRGIFFANDFLFQLGKIPGYHWVTEKLRLQATKFDLFYVSHDKETANQSDEEYAMSWQFEKAEDIFSRFISSWMSLDDWGISVTFFADDGQPWHGDGNPSFARLNINQKVFVRGGKVDVSQSISNALHANADNPGDYVIYPSLANENYIYQGYVTGSQMIDIRQIMNEDENTSAQMDILTYTPSAYDILNNQMSDAKVDDIIGEFSSDFKNDINQSLLDNPIYLGDDTKNTNVVARFSNISFTTLFGILLTRREMDDAKWKPIYDKIENTSDDPDENAKMKFQTMSRLSITAWNDVNTFTSKLDPSKFTGTDDYSAEQMQKDIDLLNEWGPKDVGSTEPNPTTDTIKQDILAAKDDIVIALKNLIKYSRTQFADNEQFDVCQSHLINVAPFFYDQANALTNGFGSVQLLSKIDLTTFGRNNDYRFGELIFGEESDLENIGDQQWAMQHIRQLYLPDITKNADTDSFMADMGFRNVSVRRRVDGADSIYQKYNEINNAQNQSWIIPYGATTIRATSPLSPGVVKGIYDADNATPVDNPKDTTWFNQGFESLLKQNGITDGRDITLSMIAQNYDSNIRALVQKLYTFDNAQSDDNKMMIWNIPGNDGKGYGLSYDNSDQNPITTSITYSSNEDYKYHFDDDMAFSDVAGMNSKLNGAKNPLYATEWNSFSNNKGVSSFRKHITENGYNDHSYDTDDGINPVTFKIVIGSVNSYGEATNEAFNYSGFQANSGLISSAISYDSFVQTNLRGENDLEKPYADALQKFWEYWVWKNPDKDGDGYNPNAGDRPDYPDI